jgi:hypothetical protein
MFTQEWATKWFAGVAKSAARGRKTPEQLEGVVRRCLESYGLTTEQVRAVLAHHGLPTEV